MATRKLRVMPVIEVPPSSASILKPTEKIKPAFTGPGPDTFLCGRCEHVLVKGTREGQFVDVFMICPRCQAMNDLNP